MDQFCVIIFQPLRAFRYCPFGQCGFHDWEAEKQSLAAKMEGWCFVTAHLSEGGGGCAECPAAFARKVRAVTEHRPSSGVYGSAFTLKLRNSTGSLWPAKPM